MAWKEGIMEFTPIPYKKAFKKKDIMATILVAVGFHILINFGLHLVYPFIPHRIAEAYETGMESRGYGKEVWPTLQALLIAPVCEEIVFRGMVLYASFQYLGKKLSLKAARRVANVFQAFVFGVLHGNPIQGVYAIVMGLIFGDLVCCFKRILPAILCHMIFNGLSIYVMKPFATLLSSNGVSYGLVAMIGAIIGMIGLGIIKNSKERT